MVWVDRKLTQVSISSNSIAAMNYNNKGNTKYIAFNDLTDLKHAQYVPQW